MKRLFAWSIVSVLTFLVGNIVVYAYWSLPSATEVKEPIAAPPVAVTTTTQSTITNTTISAEDDFNAEIHDIDLANLGLERELHFDFSNLIDEGGKLEVSNHYEEIKRGDERFVMFEDQGKYRIRQSSTVFSSRKVEGDFSIVTIDFKGRGKPVFIFPELSFIKSGAIKTLYLRPTQEEIDDRGLPIGYSLWKHETRWFAFGDERYTVRVSKGLASDGKKLDILVLEKESERQVIDAIPYYGESDYLFADIIWAGDLDRDGKLDLITDGSEGYMLYISSQAEYGRLVKLVSSGGVRGC